MSVIFFFFTGMVWWAYESYQESRTFSFVVALVFCFITLAILLVGIFSEKDCQQVDKGAVLRVDYDGRQGFKYRHFTDKGIVIGLETPKQVGEHIYEEECRIKG